MSLSRASRDRAACKVAAAIYITTTMRADGRQAKPPRQERRQLERVITSKPGAGRSIYSYRGNMTSRNTLRGQRGRIARYAGLGSERRRAAYLVATSLAMVGDTHAVFRRGHIVQAGINAGDAWALDLKGAQRGARS